MTADVQSLLREAFDALKEAGAAEPAAEAALLLTHVLERPRSWLYAWPESQVDDAARGRFQTLVKRRRTGEPVAYLTGHREFWSLDLKVTPATLIPRPETELVVERALALIPAGRNARIVDLGTGSGAIAAALASERPQWQILATDAAADTLAIAQENFTRLGLSRIDSRLGDWLTPLAGQSFDLILSNPPYVPEQDPHLSRGDLRYEPRTALAAGSDGLADLRRICGEAPQYLAAEGWLVVEHGFDQGPAVRALMAMAELEDIATHRDLGGQERVTEGRKAPTNI